MQPLEPAPSPAPNDPVAGPSSAGCEATAAPARKPPLRDVLIVAGQELSDALGSRRVLILALLFVGGAVAGTLAFVETLKSIEAGMAGVLAVSDAGKPGAMTAELMRSKQMLHTVARLVGDRALARELLSLPPLALFYGWLGFAFMPVLVMLTAAESYSRELATGSLRFSLLRTDRLSFSAGKLLGQSLLVACAIAAGALAVWVTGYFSLASFEPLRSAYYLGSLSLRIAVYAFAYVGLALGISHLCRSLPLSRALGLFALLLLALARGVLGKLPFVREHAPAAADTLLQLVPSTHMLELWQPALGDRLPAIALLLAFGITFFALGYRVRARRDA